MRGRWIKPETWSSKTLAKCSLRARLLFVALWNYADDEGRGLNDPRLIRTTLFPLDDIGDEEVAACVDELRRARLIVCYRARPEGHRNARALLAVRNWSEHQSVNRPTPSRYPAPRTKRRDSRRNHGGRMEDSRASSKEVKRREVVGDSVREDQDPVVPELPGQGSLFDPSAPDVSPNGDRSVVEDKARAETRARHPSAWRDRPNPWAKT